MLADPSGTDKCNGHRIRDMRSSSRPIIPLSSGPSPLFFPLFVFSSLLSSLLFLPRGVAAVHDEVTTSHKGAGVAEEEEAGALELGSLSQSAHHVLALPGLAQAGDLLEVAADHGGEDVAGADAVDADATGAVGADGSPLHREAARELDDGGLGRVVHGREQPFIRDQPAHARDHADAAVALVPEHLLRRRLRRHHHPRVVDRHHLRRVLVAVLHRRRQLLDPCRRDQPVQPLVPVRDLRDRLVQVLRVLDILLDVVQRPAPPVRPAQRLVVVIVGSFFAVKTVD